MTSSGKTALADLERRLLKRGVRVVRYDGDTNKNTRLEVKRDFLRNPDGSQPANYKYDVVLANYKTGGVGLTFTGATYMLCPDEEWNPAKNHQAISRIHRIGQTEPVEGVAPDPNPVRPLRTLALGSQLDAGPAVRRLRALPSSPPRGGVLQ